MIRERAFARSSAYAARVPRGDTANANAPSSFDASFALLLLLSTKRRTERAQSLVRGVRS